MSKSRKPRKPRPSKTSHELPFYQVLPLDALQTGDGSAGCGWTARVSDALVDFFLKGPSPLGPEYRLVLRHTPEALEVGPLLVAPDWLPMLDDEQHMAMADILLGRMRGASDLRTGQLLFTAALRRWTRDLVERFQRSRRRRR